MLELLSIERMVLESLARSKKNLTSLCIDTSLAPEVVEKVLQLLQEKDYVLFHSSTQNYQLNRSAIGTHLPPLQTVEMEDYLHSLGKMIKKNVLKENFLLKKIWTTSIQEMVLQNKINELKELLRKIESENSGETKSSLAEKKVFIIAQAPQGQLVREMLGEI